MKLPGQSRHASKKLNDAIAAVQRPGRNIVFLPLDRLPDSMLKRGVLGYRDSYNGRERIWLDKKLPYMAQEATAAHELAHVFQKEEGYPRAASIRNSTGAPLVPGLEHLAARINNLVMDESADLWAISRGFDMGKALRNIGLDELMGGLGQQAVVAEAADWDGYYTGLKKLERETKQAKPAKPLEIGAEAGTQVMALDYAGLSQRLGRYGLFEGLDTIWAEHWPLSREIGKELARIVKQNGVENGDKCRRAFEKILAFLKIPETLIIINCPSPRGRRVRTQLTLPVFAL